MFPFIREHWELPYGEFSPDSIGRKVGRTSAHLPRKGVIKIHGFTPVSFIYKSELGGPGENRTPVSAMQTRRSATRLQALPRYQCIIFFCLAQ